jgi:hypothetical protein
VSSRLRVFELTGSTEPRNVRFDSCGVVRDELAVGQRAKPERWSGLNLIDRSKILDKDAEYLVIKDYDQRNFSVHTGLAGVVNLNPAAFESMCAFALNLIGDCMLSELHRCLFNERHEAQPPAAARTRQDIESKRAPHQLGPLIPVTCDNRAVGA